MTSRSTCTYSPGHVLVPLSGTGSAHCGSLSLTPFLKCECKNPVRGTKHLASHENFNKFLSFSFSFFSQQIAKDEHHLFLNRGSIVQIFGRFLPAER